MRDAARSTKDTEQDDEVREACRSHLTLTLHCRTQVLAPFLLGGAVLCDYHFVRVQAALSQIQHRSDRLDQVSCRDFGVR
jgi:hypothetical protein